MDSQDGRGVSLVSLILPVYLPTLLLAVGAGVLNTFVPLFFRSLGASVSLVAILISIGRFGVVLFDLPSGFLISRFGERKMLAFGGVGLVLSSLVIATAQGLAMATFGFFLIVAATSFWFLARLAYLRAALRPDLRGRGLATAGGVMRIGRFVGPVAGGYLVEFAGYRPVFLGTAGLAAAALFFFLIFERSMPVSQYKVTAPSRAVSFGALKEILRLKKTVFLTAGVSMVVLSLVRAGRELVFPLWGEHIGLTTSAIGVVVGVSSAMDTLMFYPAGSISDRFGRRWSAMSCIVTLSLGMALVPFTHSFSALLLAGLVVGLGNGLGSGINMTLSADFAKGTETGVFLGFWRLITDFGVFLAPLLVGLVTAALALGPAALAVAGLGFAGALYHGYFVQESLERTP